MCQIAVVVLNYLNYSETECCVDSVLKQVDCNYQILVVDNGSDNESYIYLKRKYANERKVSVIHANRNYGFAKGHNIGIRYVKNRFAAEYILLLNSDTLLEDCQYLKKMIEADEDGVGVLGSKIIGRDGKEQRAFFRYVEFPASLFFYLYKICFNYGFNMGAKYFEKCTKKYKSKEILHGSVLLLTPSFFKFFEGLCDKTFLYCEEELLYLYCKQVGLREKKIDNTQIIHKGGQSAKLFYGGGGSILESYLIKSYKYVLLESFKCYLMER